MKADEFHINCRRSAQSYNGKYIVRKGLLFWLTTQPAEWREQYRIPRQHPISVGSPQTPFPTIRKHALFRNRHGSPQNEKTVAARKRSERQRSRSFVRRLSTSVRRVFLRLSFAKTRFICVFNNFDCLSLNQKIRDQNLILA